MVGVLILLAAAAIAAKALMLRRAERRLAARMVPVAARVIRRGHVPESRHYPGTNSDGQPETREVLVYSGRWEFTVEGRRYQGEVDSEGPVFTEAQMPPATIEVFHDRDDPSVSRLRPASDTALIRAWFIFAGVTAAVGAAILVISAGSP